MAPSPRKGLALFGLAGLLTSLLITAPAAGGAPAAGSTLRHACAPAHGTTVTCFATYRTSSTHHGVAASGPQLTPADIASAYRLGGTSISTATVGIVDAQDDPNAERDLAVYRARFHLPPCTTANGCFRKVNQHGAASPLPKSDPGWGVEISLDLDAVSAACPSCRILLVEGTSPSLVDLGVAVNTAVGLGAAVVSNSYGTDEFNGITRFGTSYYTHPGTPIVASSGDFGFGIPSFPAVLATTIAVGGTSLSKAGSTPRGWVEHAWDGAGSGCSGYIDKPTWQHDNHCPTRMVSDVSAVADAASGFLVYDTFGLGSDNGYLQVGGTSLSSPLIAGMIGRAGNASVFNNARRIYSHTASLFDVRGGSNGYCGGDYLCTGVAGYDGPTGAGSPNGLSAL